MCVKEREYVCVCVCMLCPHESVGTRGNQSKISGASLYLSPCYFLKAGSFTEPEAHFSGWADQLVSSQNPPASGLGGTKRWELVSWPTLTHT